MAEPRPSSARTWTVAEAGPNLDEIIDRAIADGPQRVIDDAGEAAFVVSVEDWEKVGKPSRTA